MDRIGRKKSYILDGITTLIGMAAGPLLAEWLILTMGYRFMFIVATGLCVVAILIVSPLEVGFGFSAHCSFVAPYAQSKGMLASLYFRPIQSRPFAPVLSEDGWPIASANRATYP